MIAGVPSCSASSVRILAHGVGGRHDLPIPAFYALAGAVLAVFVSFLALGLFWAAPKFRGDTAGLVLPRPVQAFADSSVRRWALRLCGLALTAFVATAAILGPDDPSRNPTAGFVYVVFWVGIVPVSLLTGPVWRSLNPLRTLHLLACGIVRGDPSRGRWALPTSLGYWPAAVGILAFTWLELVAPHGTSTGTIVTWFSAYAAVQLAGAAAFGAHWFDRCDAFEAYSGLIGRLSPLGRRGDGLLVLRHPFHGLDGLAPAPGLAATVCVMVGSTGFDSLSDSSAWVRFAQSGPLPGTALGTFGLAGTVLLFLLLYVACTGAARLVAPREVVRVGAHFAHSVVPVAVGYAIAHYYSLLLVEGQRTFILASDPLDTGVDLFGTARWDVALAATAPSTIATIQVLAVVAGHVAGVIAAHDRAVRLFPPRAAVPGQFPLLILMLGYTLTGLSLLFAV